MAVDRTYVECESLSDQIVMFESDMYKIRDDEKVTGYRCTISYIAL